MQSLHRDTTQALIELFESATGSTPSQDGQPLEGITFVEKARRLTDAQSRELKSWLITVGYAGIYEATYDFEPEAVDLVEDDDPNVMRYRCPETYQWQRIPLEETAVYQVDVRRLFNELADLLEIPVALRQGIEHPPIPGVLWKLGTARLDTGLHLPVFVVRRLGRHLDKVIDTLEAMKTPAILLSCSPSIPRRIKWPEGVAVCRWVDALVQHSEMTLLDTDWLSRHYLRGDEPNQLSNFPVKYDAHRRVLTIPGKKPWVITGELQHKVVEYLYQQTLKGRMEVPSGELLRIARGSGDRGSPRLQSLFKGSLEWEDYIERKRRGYYGFKLL